MAKAQRDISIAILVGAIYIALFLGYVPLVPQKVQDEIVPVLPLWALVTLGAYLLSSIGYNLLFFNDVPDAYNSLMKEIDLAKADLRKKGVTVD